MKLLVFLCGLLVVPSGAFAQTLGYGARYKGHETPFGIFDIAMLAVIFFGICGLFIRGWIEAGKVAPRQPRVRSK
jgi:hypothetical protein